MPRKRKQTHTIAWKQVRLLSERKKDIAQLLLDIQRKNTEVKLLRNEFWDLGELQAHFDKVREEWLAMLRWHKIEYEVMVGAVEVECKTKWKQ